MERRRRTSVAGSWYPDDPVRLAGEVDGHVANADVDPLPDRPRALVAPHAGLKYSGPVAAFGYKAVRDTRYRAIVLVGPSHFVAFRGVSIWSDGAWDTPYGPVRVESELAAAVRLRSPEIREIEAAHGREHSIEMQLPFIPRLVPGAAIVPLVMGQQSRETAFALGDAIAAAVAALAPAEASHDGPGGGAGDAGKGADATGAHPGEVLLIASSDLSHYEDARTAAALDAVVLRHVETMDPEGLMTALEREPRHACGGGPIVSVLHAARQLGATGSRVLRYADSGDVSGDKSSVVGYMAAAIW